MKAFKVFALLTVALVVLVVATGDRAVALAGKAYNYVCPVYQTERVAYTVKYGDTLYGIARTYAGHQDRWDDLRGIICDIQDANGIVDKDARWLVPGSVIVVPLQVRVNQ